MWLPSPTAPCKRSAFQRQQQRADTWLTGFACASSGRSNLCASVDDDRSTPQQSSDSAPVARPGHETLAQRASKPGFHLESFSRPGMRYGQLGSPGEGEPVRAVVQMAPSRSSDRPVDRLPPTSCKFSESFCACPMGHVSAAAVWRCEFKRACAFDIRSCRAFPAPCIHALACAHAFTCSQPG